MAGAAVRIAILANASQARSELTRTAGLADRIGSSMSKFRLPATLALGALAVGAKKAVDAASDLNEEISKNEQIFGKQSAAIQKFATTAATSLGQSKQQALAAASTFGLIGQKAGLSGNETAKFATKFTGLASDLASFNNTTPEEAIQAIGAAMRGESEPIRRYGVMLDEATLKARAMSSGLVKATKDAGQIRAAQLAASTAQTRYNDAVAEYGKSSTQAKTAEASLIRSKAALKKATQGSIPPLTAQQKALAASQEIMAQTGKAQGDFARTSDGAANKQRILEAQTANLSASLGQSLLPAYQKTLQIATQVVSVMSKHRTTTQVLIAVVAGLAVAVLAASAAQAVYNAGLIAYKGISAAIRAATIVWTNAQWALNIAMSANPIGLVVIAIVALVAVFILAYKKSDAFRAIVDKTFAAIKNVVVKAISFVVNFVKNNWAKLLPIIAGPLGLVIVLVVKNWSRIKAITTATWNGIKAVLTGVWAAIKAVVTGYVNTVRAVVTTAWNVVRTATSAAWNAVKTVIQTQVNLFMGIITGIKGRVLGVFAGAASWLISAGTSLIEGLIGGITSKIGAVKDTLTGLTDSLTSWKGPETKDKRLLRPAGRMIIQGLIDGFDDGTEGVKKTLGALTDRIQKYFDKKFKNDKVAKAHARDAIKSLKDEYQRLLKNGRAQDVINKKLAAARDRLKDLKQARKDYAQSVKGNVLSFTNITGLDTAFNSGALIAELQKRLDKTRQFAAIIQDLIARGLNQTMIDQLVQAGVEGGLATATAIQQGGQGAIDQFNDLQSQINQAASGLGNSAAGSMYDAGIQAAQGLINGLQAQAKNLEKWARRIAKDLIKAIKKELGIASPSRVFAEIGKQSVLGIEVGLRDTSGVRRAVVNLSDVMTKSFDARPQMDLAVVASGSASGGNTYNITVNAPVGSNPREIGREIASYIDAYEKAGGRRRA